MPPSGAKVLPSHILFPRLRGGKGTGFVGSHATRESSDMLSRGETTHYILRVTSLLQNVFAVHPGGGSLLYAYPSRRTRHSERQRRISVHAAFKTNGNKYQSAGRSHLPVAFPPLVPTAPPFPRCAGAQQPAGQQYPHKYHKA